MKLLKQLYKEALLNKHYKPILWLNKDFEIRKQIQKESKGFTEAQLDSIFEEAKAEVLVEIKGENK